MCAKANVFWLPDQVRNPLGVQSVISHWHSAYIAAQLNKLTCLNNPNFWPNKFMYRVKRCT